MFKKKSLILAVICAEDVFFSMADMDMSHSLSSLPPLGEPPTVDLDLSLNSNYSASPGESPSGNATVSAVFLATCPLSSVVCGSQWFPRRGVPNKMISSLISLYFFIYQQLTH